MTRQLNESYLFTYKGEVQEVKINVFIDYYAETISFIEHNPGNPNSKKAKQFIFSGRELEYMKGWHDILDGIKAATDHATKKVEAYQKEVEQEKLEIAKKLVPTP